MGWRVPRLGFLLALVHVVSAASSDGATILNILAGSLLLLALWCVIVCRRLAPPDRNNLIYIVAAGLAGRGLCILAICVTDPTAHSRMAIIYFTFLMDIVGAVYAAVAGVLVQTMVEYTIDHHICLLDHFATVSSAPPGSAPPSRHAQLRFPLLPQNQFTNMMIKPFSATTLVRSLYSVMALIVLLILMDMILFPLQARGVIPDQWIVYGIQVSAWICIDVLLFFAVYACFNKIRQLIALRIARQVDEGFGPLKNVWGLHEMRRLCVVLVSVCGLRLLTHVIVLVHALVENFEIELSLQSDDTLQYAAYYLFNDIIPSYLIVWHLAHATRKTSSQLWIDPRYVVMHTKRLLGQGGSGSVYACTVYLRRVSHVGMVCVETCSAACKVASITDAAEMSALAMELQSLQELQHPNIVRLLGISLCPPHYQLVMEKCDASLCDVIADPDTTHTQLLRHALEITTGLEYIHDRGFVHRDIKPANVLIDSQGIAKLGDLGLCAPCSLVAKSRTSSTLEFQAPETLNMTTAYTEAADIYSLGLTLWCVFAREANPYSTEPSTGFTLSRKISQHALRPDISAVDSAALRDLIVRCWAPYDPSDTAPLSRPTAREVRNELARILREVAGRVCQVSLNSGARLSRISFLSRTNLTQQADVAAVAP